ncbi:hypothetical protein V1478_007374 [Vespula squamosa]|uniref:Uncharacterized protein n=1 Tax=Vespula squamosa TaxID=30214 RepID=A0ABD2B342_VESSQ
MHNRTIIDDFFHSLKEDKNYFLKSLESVNQKNKFFHHSWEERREYNCQPDRREFKAIEILVQTFRVHWDDTKIENAVLFQPKFDVLTTIVYMKIICCKIQVLRVMAEQSVRRHESYTLKPDAEDTIRLRRLSPNKVRFVNLKV